MDYKAYEKIKKRIAELEELIAETKKRLYAHSTKPLKLCAFFNICVIFW